MPDPHFDKSIISYILPSGEVVPVGDLDRLLSFFGETAHTGQELFAFLLSCARECVEFGQRDAALDALERSLAVGGVEDEKAKAHLIVGQILEGKGDFEAAAKAYARAFSLVPGTDRTWYLLHNNLGYCLNATRRFDEAEPYLRRATEIDPTLPNAFKNLGVSFQGRGLIEEAAEIYRHATLLNPDDPRARRLLEEMLSS